MSSTSESRFKTGYTQGYSKAVTSSHTSRTAESDAPHLIPHLKPHHRILDFGCGPGTISLGLARYVPEGSVTAIDISPEVLQQAHEQQSKLGHSAPSNITFIAIDVLQDPFSSDESNISAEKVSSIPAAWKGSFDVVFGSQTLIHLADPVQAIKNLKQCLKPGGILASRDYDGTTFTFWPDPTGNLARWTAGIQQMLLAGGSVSKHGGRDVPGWMAAAGFEQKNITIGGSARVYSTPEERRWWGGLHADRWSPGEKTRQVMMERCGWSAEECDDVAKALRAWAETEGGLFICVGVETIARV